ncbi:glycerol-3-phosphate responsive antiterminator [Heyndrickxia coagulans]|nr:glycerol-3-phosphate responsive antiterminator [Heyndrickxia coagulans]
MFLLTGDLLNMTDYLDRLKVAKKHVFIHIDFIEGAFEYKKCH